MQRQGAEKWARQVFGGALLGDRRRVERLVAMAAAAARRPAGTVTRALETSAEKEGAFRLLESEDVSATAVQRAAFEAAATTCAKSKLVYVPVDQTSLSLTDRTGRRGMGRVGTYKASRGLQVMSGLAVSPMGEAIGVVDQRLWSRDAEPAARSRYQQQCLGRRFEERETRFWLQTLKDCQDRFAQIAPETKPWYQLDRGADCWPVFQHVLEHDLLLTVRAAHNRRLDGPDGPRRYLRQEVARQRVMSSFDLLVPQHGHRPRIAQIGVRACKVLISARVTSNRRKTFALNALLVEESQRRKDRISWLLLTSHPINTRADVDAVVRGYTFRWRIEDFHRCWKRGRCNVEKTQLRTRGAVTKWVTILATVAARALRLANMLRTAPELPASSEFTDYEIEACFLLSKRKRDGRKRILLGEFLMMVAGLGGFMNKHSTNLPGPTVIGRGLDDVEVMARGLRNMSEMR